MDDFEKILVPFSAKPTPSISTGSIILDRALGIKGFPRKGIVEIFGPEGTAKTTLALSTIHQIQLMGFKAVFVDTEHSLNHKYLKQLGVDEKDFKHYQPDYGEQALQLVGKKLLEDKVGVVVIDSADAIIPRKEIDGEDGLPDFDSGGGLALRARLLSTGVRHINKIANKQNKLVIFINQIRSTFGGGYSFGPTTAPSGGWALKFYPSLRLELKRAETIKEGDIKIGHWVNADVKKSRYAPPKDCKFPLIYGRGIDNELEVITAGQDLGLFEEKDKTILYEGEPMGKTTKGMRAWLQNNPTKYEEIAEKLRGG